MSTLFISHDLGVIGEISNLVLVMYLGRLVERAPVRLIFESPAHPYTRGLLRAMPGFGGTPRKRLETISGAVPIPIDIGSRCGFFGRCSQGMPGLCDRHVPPEVAISETQYVRCFLHGGSESIRE